MAAWGWSFEEAARGGCRLLCGDVIVVNHAGPEGLSDGVLSRMMVVLVMEDSLHDMVHIQRHRPMVYRQHQRHKVKSKHHYINALSSLNPSASTLSPIFPITPLSSINPCAFLTPSRLSGNVCRI